LNKYFIWPESTFVKAIFNWPFITSSTKIESDLHKMFPSGYPVLCSSGRSSIYLIMRHLKKTRSDFVGVFPYASHCVIDAISRLTTPCFGIESKNCDLRVIYHQWGYVQETKIENSSIDDCVDSLYKKGRKLFPSGSKYEIWSLPKILGTSSGGILWCKNKLDAEKLKVLRDKNGSSFFQWILRLISKKKSFLYNYWNGGECHAGKLSLLQTSEIHSSLKKWDEILTDRLIKFNLLWKFAVDGLKKPTDRFPCIIPIKFNKSLFELIKSDFPSGTRMMEKIETDNSSKMVKVIPIPIHQGIDLEWLKKINRFLTKIG